jgi:hypothetical protein
MINRLKEVCVFFFSLFIFILESAFVFDQDSFFEI